MIKLSGIAALVAASFLMAGVASAAPVTMSNCDNGGSGGSGGTGGNGGNGGSGGAGGGTSTPIVVPANAVFTTPDINYVSHGQSALLKSGAFSLTINSALGDQLAIDKGTGFQPTTGTLIVNAGPMLETSTANQIMFAQGGTVTFLSGGTAQMIGQLGALTLTKTDVGYEYLAGVKVTSGALAPSFKNGGGFFGFLYNVKITNNDILANGFAANAKGDIAAIKGSPPPAVPEPATLALMAMGLSGLFASARRRIL